MKVKLYTATDKNGKYLSVKQGAGRQWTDDPKKIDFWRSKSGPINALRSLRYILAVARTLIVEKEIELDD